MVQWLPPTMLSSSTMLMFIASRVECISRASVSASFGKSPTLSMSMPWSIAIAPRTVSRSTIVRRTADKSRDKRRTTASPRARRPCRSAAYSNASGTTSATLPRPASEYSPAIYRVFSLDSMSSRRSRASLPASSNLPLPDSASHPTTRPARTNRCPAGVFRRPIHVLMTPWSNG